MPAVLTSRSDQGRGRDRGGRSFGRTELHPGGRARSCKITLIQGVQGDKFYISMACGAQAAADELGVNLTVQGPEKFDATLQTPLLDAVSNRSRMRF